MVHFQDWCVRAVPGEGGGGRERLGNLNILDLMRSSCPARHVGSGNHTVIRKLFTEQRNKLECNGVQRHFLGLLFLTTEHISF